MVLEGRRSLTERMLGAAQLETAVYEEVEADPTATSQAATVVAVVAIASAIGALRGGGGSIVGALIAAFVGWLIWAGVTYLIGTKLFDGTATWGELLRTLGFAQSPGVFLILGFIPLLGWLVRLVVWVWMLVAGIIAIRQALDFSTGKAIATALLGWLALVLVTAAGALLTALTPW